MPLCRASYIYRWRWSVITPQLSTQGLNTRHLKWTVVSCFLLLSKPSSKCTSFSLSLMARISSDWQELEPAHDLDLAALTGRQDGWANRGGHGQLFFGRKPELHTRLQTLTNVPQPCPLCKQAWPHTSMRTSVIFPWEHPKHIHI